FVTNSGPGDTFGFFSALPGGVLGTVWAPASYISQFFEIQLWATASASEWKRHRDLAPSLNFIKNAEGLNPGYNARNTLQRWAPDLQWAMQGKDESLGKLHSGVTVTNDGSCRDHNKSPFGFVSTGVPLLAGSDCPDTWGASGWVGARPIPGSTWEQLATEQGSDFTFDFWKVPPDLQDNSKFLGDFQVYGVTVDYGLEARQRFGKVVPGQSGEPLLEGYPMGLELRFDAFVFHLSDVANAFFYRAVLVNKSDEVYGVGLDYDSLYFGTLLRPFHVRQNPTSYAITERGAVVSNVLGGHPKCNNARVVGDIRGCVTSAPRGFQAGASGVIVLKSPIGDLRNKLFTRGDASSNPFYNPSHSLAGDTITFNHNNLCGFTCTQAQHIAGSGTSYQAARSFGTLAHREALALNDRTSTDLTERQYFDLFHNQDWPQRWTPAGVRFGTGDVGVVGGFNRYVPGVSDGKPQWRYTNRPKGATAAGPDTLYLGSCGTKGCTAAWVDTLPGGFPQNLHNTSWVGAGPFPLEAGDTTSFVFAYWSAPDSISSELLINKIIDFYLEFYLGPSAPTPPKIVATSILGGAREAGETEVTLYFDDAAINWVDPFFESFAQKLEKAVAPDPLARVRTLNPWLPAAIRARAEDNVEAVYVFKSCNLGATWTASTACTRDEARDFEGKNSGPGWRAYAKLASTTRTFTDRSVTAGQRYLYSLVVKSKGAEFLIADSIDSDGNGSLDRLGARNFPVAPSLLNTLSASTGAPNVAAVYIPASITGGGKRAQPVFREIAGPVKPVTTGSSFNIRFGIVGQVSDTVKYRIVYADSVVVTSYALSDGTVDSARVQTFQRADTASTGTTARLANYGTSESLLSTHPQGVPVTGGVRTTSTVTDAASGKTYTRTITTLTRAKGADITKVVIDNATGGPLYVVGGRTTGELVTPPELLARAGSPPILITTNLTRGGTFLGQAWFGSRGDTLRSLAEPTLDWISAGNARSVPTGALFAEYEIKWQDREFGNPGEIELDFRDQGGTDAAFRAMLAARVIAEYTVTDSASAALIGVPQSELLRVAVPFTIRNRTTGGTVTLAMLKSGKLASQLLGRDLDTLRVAVPEDVWVPGEPLVFIESFDRPKTRRVGTRTVFTLTNGQLERTSDPVVTYSAVYLGCTSPRGDPDRTCNPVRGDAATGYVRVFPGQTQVVSYHAPFN
ncbi:MAG: hypothetical protein HY561_08905, partial [Gemmatimonadetes bacterium]|nr:hypothetical protein [Gemmatimonadota bacterium]